MILDKAIEIGELNIKEAGPKMPPDTRVALIILTQAAERLRTMRRDPLITPHFPLPDEEIE